MSVRPHCVFLFWRFTWKKCYKTIGIYTDRSNNGFYRREHFRINMNIHGLLLGKIKDPSVLGSIGNKLTGAGLVIAVP
jgi:hypothetical protein